MATLLERRKSDRKRSNRYREKRRTEGGRLIQVMLSSAASEILEQEQKCTGESLVSIVNRAIEGLKDISLEVPVEKQPERKLEQKPIHDLILEMDKKGRDEWQISKALNDKGYPTADDKDKWYPSTIRNFLNRVKSGS
ncbi:MAG: recombinase family protein [Desulfobacterales bacterium]